MILLAAYFCCADIVLISQTLWYNELKAYYQKKEKRGRPVAETSPSEQSPLLSDENQSQSPKRQSSAQSGGGLPGSHRRRLSSSGPGARRGSITRAFEEPKTEKSWRYNTVAVIGLLTVGTVGWALCWSASLWKPNPNAGHGADGGDAPLGASILGYLSAVAYLW